MATASAARRGRWRRPAMNSCRRVTRPTLELQCSGVPAVWGPLRLIATLHDPAVIRKLLAHLGMVRSGPSPGPAPPESNAAAS
jgi:hypothetical protein